MTIPTKRDKLTVVEITGVELPEFFMITRLAGKRDKNLTADERRIAEALGVAAEWDGVGNGVYSARADADKVAAALQVENPDEIIQAIGSKAVL